MIERLCVIGVGLIGGSLALAVREHCREIVGYGRHDAQLQRAIELGVIDHVEHSISQTAAGADIVVAAVPLGAIEAVFQAVAPNLERHAVLTDVGSSKLHVVESARRTLGDALPRFVPGHPIAGTEHSGVEAAFPELFRDRRVVLTPIEETDGVALSKVQTLWEFTGARVECLDVAHHDAVLAETSHLPHVLAFALVDSLARMSDRDEIFRYAAGGFRDFTRIAASNPIMWRDICLANREALLVALRRYHGDLQTLVDAIEAEDGARLEDIFSRAKNARDEYCG